MSTQKRKFELFARLQALGFTYEEAACLRRIEMTLQRWAEAECGTSNDFASFGIERDETTGKPYRCRYPHNGKMTRFPLADREAGALKRLKAIVDARNAKLRISHPDFILGEEIIPYHQTDPRGCMLYLVKRSDLPTVTDDEIKRHSGPSAVASPESRMAWLVDTYHNRGLAITT